MIELTDIRKSFGDHEILKNVSLSVSKGDVVAVLGPSGSGKTTLLRIANFLETADAGRLVFEGESLDLAHLHRRDIARIRAKTGFVFQNYNLFRNLTALENVTAGLRFCRGLGRREADEIGRASLAEVGMLDRADHYPSALSGGQQQRVGIARAIAANPDVIYLDEPTSALDPELVGEVLAVIRKLAAEGRTMVLVTHELNFARHVANRIVFMADGLVVEENTPEAFFTNPREERTRQFLRRLDGSADYVI
ncbi:amino acid ABC transporter ATP-binding protein [Sutterella sp.]|uniref:amino acid ABC transporter ATP-binding protein n=1 Tax=Sutterella sp. TaxID=1981025 RepID=UPI0026DF3E23|nr:amino acid ABC transporter ATP-binding protein [Sutterella sp.]MDO5532708.1 amino acid ABC transporter ATP-binding protein [Sutterella sp.]